MSGKRRAEGDGDQDDRFVNQGASSSSASGAADQVRNSKRKAESEPEGEERRCEEVIIEECQLDWWVCEITRRAKEGDWEKVDDNQVIVEIDWDDVN